MTRGSKNSSLRPHRSDPSPICRPPKLACAGLWIEAGLGLLNQPLQTSQLVLRSDATRGLLTQRWRRGFPGLGLIGPAGLGLIGPAGLGLIGPAGLGLIGPAGLGLIGPAGLGLIGPAQSGCCPEAFGMVIQEV